MLIIDNKLITDHKEILNEQCKHYKKLYSDGKENEDV